MRLEIIDYLASIGQLHLSLGLNQLGDAQRDKFYRQLKKYPKTVLEKQLQSLRSQKIREDSFSSPINFHTSGSAADQRAGERLLSEGKVGCIVLSGGQGSRLGQIPSKGMIHVSLVKNKTIFQLIFEKSLAASLRAGCDLPIAIMTSPLNDAAMKNYLSEANRFGMAEEKVSFFQQKMLPLLNEQEKWLLEAPGKIAEGPDGNGDFFKAFHAAGILQEWKKSGIEMINVILVDNPLADPFDAELCGLHYRTEADVTIKCCRKSHPLEQVGTIVMQGSLPRVIEYLEFPKEEADLKNQDGSLKFPLANIGMFCFRLDFLERMASHPGVSLPWHANCKKIKVKNCGFHSPLEETRTVWKFESFIFDLLPFADTTELLVFPREKVFSPLKNLEGEYSLRTVKKSLLAHDRAVFSEISGLMPSERIFELDPAFHYPTFSILDKWKGRSLPEEKDYITAE